MGSGYAGAISGETEFPRRTASSDRTVSRRSEGHNGGFWVSCEKILFPEEQAIHPSSFRSTFLSGEALALTSSRHAALKKYTMEADGLVIGPNHLTPGRHSESQRLQSKIREQGVGLRWDLMENNSVRPQGSPDKSGLDTQSQRPESEQIWAWYRDEFGKVEFSAMKGIEYYVPTFTSFQGFGQWTF